MTAEKFTPTEVCDAVDGTLLEKVDASVQNRGKKEQCIVLAVKQSGKPVSISTDVTINTIGTLIVDDSSLTQHKIAPHLGIAKVTVQKVCHNCLIVYHSQSRKGKFFGFRTDGSYRCAIHPIDSQLWLLLRNTIFFTPVALNDFFTL